MAWVAPVIAGASAIYNAYSQNKRNKEQTELADTAVQRRMKDLSAAGINPALAYMNAAGGAQTPNLDAVEFDPSVATEVQNAYTQATQRSMAKLTMANLTEQNQLLAQQTNGAQAAARLTNAQAMEIEARIPYSALDAQNRSHVLSHELLKIAQEVSRATSEADIAWTQRSAAELDLKQKQMLAPLAIEYQKLLNRAEALGISRQELDQRFAEQAGTAPQWLRLLRELAGIAGAFQGLRPSTETIETDTVHTDGSGTSSYTKRRR